MKAMIMDMCILSHKTQCFLMFGHVVGVGAGKLRGFTVMLPYLPYVPYYPYLPYSWHVVFLPFPSRVPCATCAVRRRGCMGKLPAGRLAHRDHGPSEPWRFITGRNETVGWFTLWLCQISYWKLPFIVDLPINSMVIFHSYVTNYQRVPKRYSCWMLKHWASLGDEVRNT